VCSSDLAAASGGSAGAGEEGVLLGSSVAFILSVLERVGVGPVTASPRGPGRSRGEVSSFWNGQHARRLRKGRARRPFILDPANVHHANGRAHNKASSARSQTDSVPHVGLGSTVVCIFS